MGKNHQQLWGHYFCMEFTICFYDMEIFVKKFGKRCLKSTLARATANNAIHVINCSLARTLETLLRILTIPGKRKVPDKLTSYKFRGHCCWIKREHVVFRNVCVLFLRYRFQVRSIRPMTKANYVITKQEVPVVRI